MAVEETGHKKRVPQGLWTKCPKCEQIIYNKELEKNLKVCPKCHYNLLAGAREAQTAGVDGVIVPDLIIEEGFPLEQALARQGIHLIYLVAPTTPPARRAQIARRSRGFLYAVSLTGVTGARRALPKDVGAFLADVRRRSPENSGRIEHWFR